MSELTLYDFEKVFKMSIMEFLAFLSYVNYEKRKEKREIDKQKARNRRKR